MLKRIALVTALIASLVMPALASVRSQDIHRIDKSTRVFRQIMQTPDNAIPQELLESASCIAIIPGETQAAFIVGGQHGKGIAICRTAHGWSAPAFLSVGGGSIGLQAGASSSDIVMLFMNSGGLRHLLNNKFKIGVDATAAAGPVGRHASAGTDIKLNSEILTYSRSHGIFAGVSLNGAVVHADHRDDRALYGSAVSRRKILDGTVAVPPVAHPLLKEIAQYTPKESTAKATQTKGARS